MRVSRVGGRLIHVMEVKCDRQASTWNWNPGTVIDLHKIQD